MIHFFDLSLEENYKVYFNGYCVHMLVTYICIKISWLGKLIWYSFLFKFQKSEIFILIYSLPYEGAMDQLWGTMDQPLDWHIFFYYGSANRLTYFSQNRPTTHLQNPNNLVKLVVSGCQMDKLGWRGMKP
jgi:hypothetical protein